ncbi:MAG TPA: glycoside hydrolase family 108 protein [Xanthobacteraceae bacterium]|nr:glycoside hydrolase family 108 protein [Xanthobacteraceae bacterium]
MKQNYSAALSRVLRHEGGFVHHPKDPGGATNQGIIQTTYDAYRRQRGLPTQSVRNLTSQERDAIYKTQYWDKIAGDRLPLGVDYVVFDGAVNSGVAQSVRWLQRALRADGLYSGLIDGLVGAKTLDGVDQHPDHDALIGSICDQRMAFLRDLKTWGTFGKGWTNRVREVRTGGQAWAMGSVPGKATAGAGAAKATEADTKISKTPEGKVAVEEAKSGTSLSGLGSLAWANFDTVTARLSDLAALPDWAVRIALGAAIVAGLGYGGYLLVKAGRRWWQARQDRQPAPVAIPDMA